MSLDSENIFDLNDEEKIKVEQLKNRVESCPNLKIGTEIEILGRYLCCNNWKVDDAFKHINNYYDFKNEYPKLITNTQTPDDLDEIIKLNTRILLPHTDKQGKYILYQKPVDVFDKIENYIMKMGQLDDLISESILSSPRGQKHGMTIITDTTGVNANFIKKISPKMITLAGKKYDIIPIRLEDRRFHLIIRNRIITSFLPLLLPFLGNISKSIIFHNGSNLEKLKQYVGQENLPYECGGPKKNIFDSSYLREFLKSRYNYVKKSQKYYKEI